MNIKIEVNRRISVRWGDNDYKSNIQDVSSDTIAIGIPMKEGLFLPLHKGDQFKVFYYHTEKEVYEFQGIVTGRKAENNVQFILIEYPKAIKEVQRRAYVRVRVGQPIRYVRISGGTPAKMAEDILNSGKGDSATLVDISGGGLSLKLSGKAAPGDMIIADIDLLKDKVRVGGKIVRTNKDENGNEMYGVSFIQIDERSRDKIIQLIFEIMRKQRKTV